MKTLSPGDEGYFTTYCTKLYDRHYYKVHDKDGNSVVVDSYDLVKAMWFEKPDRFEFVEVIDPKPKKRGGGGF